MPGDAEEVDGRPVISRSKGSASLNKLTWKVGGGVWVPLLLPPAVEEEEAKEEDPPIGRRCGGSPCRLDAVEVSIRVVRVRKTCQ